MSLIIYSYYYCIGLFLISSFKDLQFGWINYIRFIFSNMSTQRASTLSGTSLEATGPREPFSPMTTGSAPGAIYIKAADMFAATITNPRNQPLTSRASAVPTAAVESVASTSAAPPASSSSRAEAEAEGVQHRKKSVKERFKRLFSINDLHRFGSKRKKKNKQQQQQQQQQSARKGGADGSKTSGSPLGSPRGGGPDGPDSISIEPAAVRFTRLTASPRSTPREQHPYPYEPPSDRSNEPPNYYENMYRPAAAPSSVSALGNAPVPAGAAMASSPRQPSVNLRMLLNSQQQQPRSGFPSHPSSTTHASTPENGSNYRGLRDNNGTPIHSAQTGYSSQNETVPLLQLQPPDEQSPAPQVGARQQPLNSTASSDASQYHQERNAGESSALATLTSASPHSTLMQNGEPEANARPLSGESEISQDSDEEQQQPPEVPLAAGAQRYAPRARPPSEESDQQNYYSNTEFVSPRQQPATAAARPPPPSSNPSPLPRTPPPARYPDPSRLVMDTDLDDPLEAHDSFYSNAQRAPPQQPPQSWDRSRPPAAIRAGDAPPAPRQTQIARV